MTDQTEWRSGDVVVTEIQNAVSYWQVTAPWLSTPAGAVAKDMFRDPQLLAEQLDAQRPKPRYYVGEHEESVTGLPAVYDRKARFDEPVAAGWTIPMAERIARLLNADEADQ